MDWLGLAIKVGSAPPGVIPTWAIVLIVVGAAIIAGLVFWFIKKREQ